MRGEPVVHGVMTATLSELARVGYSALRIEDVATQAGVNKTTVYRRWPTKPDLVREAILSMSGEALCAPDTGSLRTDLLEIGRTIVKFATSPYGGSIARLILTEGPSSELSKIARGLKDTFESLPRGVVQRAMARGELSPDVDGLMLVELIDAAVTHRYFHEQSSVDEGYLRRLVDLLLHGASPTRERRTPTATGRAKHPSRGATTKH